MFFSIFEERVSAYVSAVYVIQGVQQVNTVYLFIFGLDTVLCINTVKSKFDQGGTVCTIVTKALDPNCTSVNENGIET